MDSMTGFAHVNKKKNNIIWDMKISSVNSKFLEYRIDGIKDLYLQDVLKQILQNEISRGKVYVQINYEKILDEADSFVLNEEELEKYKKEIDRISAKMNIKNDISVMSLIRFYEANKGKKEQPENQILEEDLKDIFKSLLDKFKKDRKKEGQKLKKQFLKYFQILSKNAEDLKKIKKLYDENMKIKIKEKLDQFDEDEIDELDKKNIEKEMNFWIFKGDFEEEIVRINAHLGKFKDILDDDNIGKKMGFLVQELHREFNTLGDKVLDVKGKEIAIECKIIVDRIREQSMNIE
jgi:uncharacterized protein (TIGR00255 family)